MVLVTTRSFGTRVIGVAGAMLGTLADLAAGASICEHLMWQGLLAHLCAVLICSIGLALFDDPGTGQHRLKPGLAALFSLVLFPGLGTTAWLLARGILALYLRPGSLSDAQNNRSAGSALLVEFDDYTRPATGASGAGEFIGSIAEARYAPTPALRRGALEILCRAPSPRSLFLAHEFLADPDSDVRALAAVAISRIERQMNEALRAAVSLVELEPLNGAHHAALGLAYLNWAGENEAETPNHRLFLVRAREALSRAITLTPAEPVTSLAFAEVLLKLGDLRSAQTAATAALHEDPGNPAGYRLAMEIALRERNFVLLMTIARKASLTIPAQAQDLDLIRGWLTDYQELVNAIP